MSCDPDDSFPMAECKKQFGDAGGKGNNSRRLFRKRVYGQGPLQQRGAGGVGAHGDPERPCEEGCIKNGFFLLFCHNGSSPRVFQPPAGRINESFLSILSLIQCSSQNSMGFTNTPLTIIEKCR